MFGQCGGTIRIAQFVYDHRRAGRLLQQSLSDPPVRINPRCVDGTNPCARDRCHGESPILAVGREQLHCVADARLKSLCQARTDDDRAGVVAKVIKVPLNQLVKNIGGLRVQGGIDPVKIDCRVLK